MRLTAVVLSTSNDQEEIVFSATKQDPNARYLLRAMVGVDAENLVPKFMGFGLQDGKPLYEYVIPDREIVMRVSLAPRFAINEDVSTLRDRIYRAISATRTGQVTLQFEDGGSLVSSILGKITKMEVGYFSRDPELQLTFLCDDTIFRGVTPVQFGPSDLPDTIPVPFADNESTAPHGFTFTIQFTGTTSTFVIQDALSLPNWEFEITPASSFLVNDQLTISTEFGAKRAYLNRAIGTDMDVMDRVIAGSIWPQIFPGPTTLYFPQKANFDWVSLEYRSAFWGL